MKTQLEQPPAADSQLERSLNGVPWSRTDEIAADIARAQSQSHTHTCAELEQRAAAGSRLGTPLERLPVAATDEIAGRYRAGTVTVTVARTHTCADLPAATPAATVRTESASHTRTEASPEPHTAAAHTADHTQLIPSPADHGLNSVPLWVHGLNAA